MTTLPESFATANGKYLLRELKRQERITLLCVDECHTSKHWAGFRPDIERQTSMLRAFLRPDSPTIVMTATATSSEVKGLVKNLGLGARGKPVLIASNPVQGHFKFNIVKRPANNLGMKGIGDKPGLWQLLQCIYFDQYFEDKKNKRVPKKLLVFSKTFKPMIALHTIMRRMTGERSAATSSFCMIHSDLLRPTEKTIMERIDEYDVIYATTRMLLGHDLDRIDIVIFLTPFGEVSSVLQGGGRGGRRKLNGFRSSVQIYQLFNGSDLTIKNKTMTDTMRTMCRTASTSCTRKLLREHFHLGGGEPGEQMVEQGLGCCSYCDSLDG